MSTIKIKNFSEIDFVNIDASQDVLLLPNGQTYHFSDHMCDNCWTGGTVLETREQEKKYYCVLCQNNLIRISFTNDFLPPLGDTLEFLLPGDWKKEDREKWYAEFKERRIAQEKIKADILERGTE